MSETSTQTTLNITPVEPSKYSLGITFGIITGLGYIVLLLVKYSFFASSPVPYGIFGSVSYLIILLSYVLCGIQRKKQLGGYAETRELFLTLLIAIIITEGCYVVFNYIYLTFIDPDFMKKYSEATYQYLSKRGVNTTGIQEKMKQLNDQSHSLFRISINLLGLGIWIIIDSIICLVISFVLRKPKPQF